jgi:antirestriction protein ArdC
MPRPDDDGPATRLFARATPVFNADQVDGYAAPVSPSFDPAQRLDAIDAFTAKTGANLELGGQVVCNIPGQDKICLPSHETYFPTATSTTTECFYSTELHELVHWTGAKGRCDRELANRFKTDAYAVKDLVAELGAAFLCAARHHR